VNLPNYLTLSRIVITFVIMGLLFVGNFMASCAAFVLFVAACLTDLADGWLARRKGLISDFGKIMDPLADKILVLGLFLTFVQLQLIPAWMVAVIMAREFFVTGLRIFALRRGVVLAAENAGKHKTVSQMGAISLIMLFILLKESGYYFSFWDRRYEEAFRAGIWVMMISALLLTVYSGAAFVWRNRKLIKTL